MGWKKLSVSVYVNTLAFTRTKEVVSVLDVMSTNQNSFARSWDTCYFSRLLMPKCCGVCLI